jgi:penicillin V acylase-like amidase (Ntn superfamily)
MWSIVYDVNNRHIYFRTFDNQKIRKIDTASFDFSCRTPVKVLDINAGLEGDVTQNFVEYTQQINYDLIQNAYNQTVYLPKFPEEKIEAFSKYPDTTVCRD